MGKIAAIKSLGDLASRPKNVQFDFIRFGFWQGCYDPFFAVLLPQFKKSPTKTKALLLYDLFCKVDSPFEVNAGTRLAPKNTRLVDIMKSLKENKDKRDDMTLLTRLLTKSQSKKPTENVFDEILEATAVDQHFERFDPNEAVTSYDGGRQGLYQDSWDQFARFQRELSNAGFDVKGLKP